MDRLRAETLAEHKAAESHPLQRALALGTLPRALYVRHLAQLRHVHAALDSALQSLAPVHAAIGTVLRPEHLQTSYLDDDLAYLGATAEERAVVSATVRLVEAIDRMAEGDPLAILGYHYVLEGSNNGSKFLARVVQRAYDLPPGRGTRYMDPYGDRQKEVWAQFKTDMNAVGFSTEQADALVASAKVMFGAIAEMGDDLLVAHPLAAASSPASH
ncbi:MAG: biliverdin-producing heme oxygenase [Vicinamibacterales bacterium]